MDEFPGAIQQDLPTYIVTPYPLYLPPEKAAKASGLSERIIYKMLNDPIDPIPYVMAGEKGTKKLVSMSDLPDYMKRRHYTNVG